MRQHTYSLTIEFFVLEILPTWEELMLYGNRQLYNTPVECMSNTDLYNRLYFYLACLYQNCSSIKVINCLYFQLAIFN